MSIVSAAKLVLRRMYTFMLTIRAFGLGVNQFSLAIRFWKAGRSPERPDRAALDAAIAWLCRAQDAVDGQGVSCVFELKSGWGVPYPETSGYIIPTFLTYADLSGDRSYVNRACEIADWEISIQTSGGGVLSNPKHTYTRVFNTGMVILGWCALFENTKNEAYLKAAMRAGDYLLGIQEANGSWVRDTHCGARTYHARVSWSLLRLAELAQKEAYAESAVRNLRWVLQQQQENGWFASCGFFSDDPIMHVIVYTLRGLIESHIIGGKKTDDLNILPALIIATDNLCDAIERFPVKGISGMIPRSFDANWESRDQDSCLTGNVQLSCYLFRLARLTGTDRYRKVGEKVLQASLLSVIEDVRFPEVNGALAGSYPVYFGYHANSYPNWATKFMADALLMKIGFDGGLTVEG